MRRLLAAAATSIGLLVLLPAPAPAQGTGSCTHQGRAVQCPAGLPPGSQSVAFVPGGTNWRNAATGAIVFVPSTTFPPFVASPTPTAPPGPTTSPGPGAPPSGTPGPAGPPLFPLTAEGLMVLTLPSDASGSRTIVNPNPNPMLEAAKQAHDRALREHAGAQGALVIHDFDYYTAGFGRYRGQSYVRGARGKVVVVTPELASILSTGSVQEALAAIEAAPEDEAARQEDERVHRRARDASTEYFKASYRLDFEQARAETGGTGDLGDAASMLGEMMTPPPGPAGGVEFTKPPVLDWSDSSNSPRYEPFPNPALEAQVM
jgi:hypothetical protein